MKLAPFSARPSVGRACLHHQLRSSSCDACRSVCPFDAITLSNGRMVLDADKCAACGNCRFVCPTSALENVPSPKRNFHLSALVAPLSIVPPTVQELLAWHTERGIRSVEIDAGASPGWLMALAALNLRLKQLGEPLWFTAKPKEDAINSGRRRWLRVNQSDSAAARVSPDHYQKTDSYIVNLDRARCYLCGACSRICPTAAIEINEEAMTVHHSRCMNCKACTDLCLPQALKLEKSPAQVADATQFPFKSALCPTCRQTFQAWRESEDECPVCQRHAFGMREA